MNKSIAKSQSKKSDSPAKKICEQYLKAQDFDNIEFVKAPSDIKATKGGEQWFFEVKMTRVDGTKYFGAATLTEWKKALEDPDHFRFIVVQLQSDSDEMKMIKEYTPAEMLKYSTIPPFKINFNVPLQECKARKNVRQSKSVLLTEENCHKMVDFYKSLK